MRDNGPFFPSYERSAFLIYADSPGKVKGDTFAMYDTVRLIQERIVELFITYKTLITKYLSIVLTAGKCHKDTVRASSSQTAKEGKTLFENDYFKEFAERFRSICAEDSPIHQQITAICQECSIESNCDKMVKSIKIKNIEHDFVS